MAPLKDQNPAFTFPRYDFLDGIRAILALWVVANHTYLTANPVYGNKIVDRCFQVLAHGQCAVCFFITLSGFCLTLPVLKNEFTLNNGVGTFLKRRAWRILPPYYFAFLLSIILINALIHDKTGALWDRSLPVTSHNIVTHLLLIQNFFQNDIGRINYLFWSIAVEWQIYFFFPILLISWRSMGAISTTIAAILASLAVEHWMEQSFHIAPSAHFIGLFALGMLASHVSFSSEMLTEKHKAVPWRLIAVITFVVWIAYKNIFHLFPDPTGDILFGLGASSILIVASRYPKGRLHGLLNFKPLVFVGTFSYSLYLVHTPFLQILWQYPFSRLQSAPNLMFATLIIIGMPIIVLLSYVFYLFCERPFLQKKGVKIIHIK